MDKTVSSQNSFFLLLQNLNLVPLAKVIIVKRNLF